MPFSNISLFRDVVRALRINLGDESPLSGELRRELEDWRRFLLNLLVALLTVHALSPPNVFVVMTLALVIYTINLHITINTSFLQNRPALSRLLHAVPLLGILCISIFGLINAVQSPPIVVAILLACALPPLVIGFHLVRRYFEIILPLPVQMQEVARQLPVPADATVTSRC